MTEYDNSFQIDQERESRIKDLEAQVKSLEKRFENENNIIDWNNGLYNIMRNYYPFFHNSNSMINAFPLYMLYRVWGYKDLVKIDRKNNIHSVVFDEGTNTLRDIFGWSAEDLNGYDDFLDDLGLISIKDYADVRKTKNKRKAKLDPEERLKILNERKISWQENKIRLVQIDPDFMNNKKFKTLMDNLEEDRNKRVKIDLGDYEDILHTHVKIKEHMGDYKHSYKDLLDKSKILQIRKQYANRNIVSLDDIIAGMGLENAAAKQYIDRVYDGGLEAYRVKFLKSVRGKEKQQIGIIPHTNLNEKKNKFFQEYNDFMGAIESNGSTWTIARVYGYYTYLYNEKKGRLPPLSDAMLDPSVSLYTTPEYRKSRKIFYWFVNQDLQNSPAQFMPPYIQKEYLHVYMEYVMERLTKLGVYQSLHQFSEWANVLKFSEIMVKTQE